MQLPLLRQGVLEHGFVETLQSLPVKLAGHTHAVNAELQTPPFKQRIEHPIKNWQFEP